MEMQEIKAAAERVVRKALFVSRVTCGVAVAAIVASAVHSGAHLYVAGEQGWLDMIEARRARLVAELAAADGYVRPQESEAEQSESEDQELSPKILCTMEAVKRDISPAHFCGLMHVESANKGRALSVKGAIGLMQIMPFNAPRCADECGVRNAKDLWNPKKNVCCGGLLFAEDLARNDDDPELAYQAYNGGQGAVKVIAQCGRNEACMGGYIESYRHAKKILKVSVRDSRS